MRIAGKRSHPPIRNNDPHEHNRDRNRPAITRPPRVVETNVANPVKPVVKRDKQKCNIDSNKPRVLKEAPLDDFKRQASRRAHLSCKMLDPKMHDQEHEQSSPRDALQIPINGASGHLLHVQSYYELATEYTELTETRIVSLGDLCDLCGKI